MKAIRIFFMLIIIGFASDEVRAQGYQADVFYVSGSWQLSECVITTPEGTFRYGPYNAIESHALPTPSGNGIISVTFQLDMGDPRVPENGENKMASIVHYFYSGKNFEVLDGEMIITADGRSKAVYHINGQPDPVVLKDDGCMPNNPCTGEELCGRATKEISYWNSNFHMNFYGSYIGSASGYHYSITGSYNERIQFPGRTITVPLTVKIEDHMIAVFYVNYSVVINSNGEAALEDTGVGTGECR